MWKIMFSSINISDPLVKKYVYIIEKFKEANIKAGYLLKHCGKIILVSWLLGYPLYKDVYL